MRVVRITGTAILLLLLGIAVPAYAQHEEQGERQDHPEQRQGGHEQAGHEQHHAQPQQQRQDQNNRQEHAQQQQGQDQNNRQQHAQRQYQDRQQEHARQERGDQPSRHSPEQERFRQSAWQEHRSQNWRSDHRTWEQRGGYRGDRIPDDRYRGSFGPSHEFRINTLPFLVVGGYPRFQYQGYWISAVDPWPEYWGDDWYDNEDVYVNYVDNGYYLYNRRYPSSGVAINITF